ncbi:SDR family oxidoreductase [Deinococcus sp. Arct2-2]|uniref:SDR family oxidoreductase n=1 Tax=Deinococcus sp. Arct2-2 TaxID=2568653 RepID=UPI0010A51A94|nr:SDR family oxidoreductase [Deinococcus sp. Arct2-2]THF71711.1 SDR family oxidoreductase [Deinococcus sp. Arct2-2]
MTEPETHTELQPASPLLFVMGATGNMGGEIARQLLAAGARVRVGVRSPERVTESGAFAGAEIAHFDASDASSFGALAGVQRMFLLWPPGTDVTKDVLPVIAAAKEHGVQQMVFLSILGAERVRIVPHRRVEQALEASGMAWVFLRASYFMQNLSGVHRDDIRVRREIFLPAGQGRTSFVDVRDVAAVGAKALMEGHRNRAYNLTGGAALTYAQAAGIFSVTLGKRVRYVSPSPIRFVRVVHQRGTAWTFALFMLAEYTVAKLGLAAEVSTTVAEVLGRPPISLRQFAEDFRKVWL